MSIFKIIAEKSQKSAILGSDCITFYFRKTGKANSESVNLVLQPFLSKVFEVKSKLNFTTVSKIAKFLPHKNDECKFYNNFIATNIKRNELRVLKLFRKLRQIVHVRCEYFGTLDIICTVEFFILRVGTVIGHT